MWMLMKVICVYLPALPVPKLTGIVLLYKWLPGKCIDTPVKAGSIIVPLSMPVTAHWCELAGVHAQNKYWRDHIFRLQAIDYAGQCVPMIDWLLYTQTCANKYIKKHTQAYTQTCANKYIKTNTHKHA